MKLTEAQRTRITSKLRELAATMGHKDMRIEFEGIRLASGDLLDTWEIHAAVAALASEEPSDGR